MFKYLFTDFASLLESRRPIISSATAMLGYVKVLRVEEVFVLGVPNVWNNSRLQIDQLNGFFLKLEAFFIGFKLATYESARNVMLIVSLIEEHVFAIVSLTSEVFYDSIRSDSVLFHDLKS